MYRIFIFKIGEENYVGEYRIGIEIYIYRIGMLYIYGEVMGW